MSPNHSAASARTRSDGGSPGRSARLARRSTRPTARPAPVEITAYTTAETADTSRPPADDVDHPADRGVDAEGAQRGGLDHHDQRLRDVASPGEALVGAAAGEAQRQHGEHRQPDADEGVETVEDDHARADPDAPDRGQHGEAGGDPDRDHDQPLVADRTVGHGRIPSPEAAGHGSSPPGHCCTPAGGSTDVDQQRPVVRQRQPRCLGPADPSELAAQQDVVELQPRCPDRERPVRGEGPEAGQPGRQRVPACSGHP